MRNTIRNLGALTAFLVAGLAIHSPATAQEAQTLSAPTISPAEQLELKADQPVVHDNWLPAAAELEHAARLRPANDPEALTDLMGAATLYASADRPTVAISLLQEVAGRAEHIGAFDVAAHAYTGIIGLEMKVGDNDDAAFYVTRLQALAKRPGLTPEQKQAILTPLGQAGGTCN